MNYLRKLIFLWLMSSSSLAFAQSTADFVIWQWQNPGGGCGNASVEFALIDSFQTFGINGTYIIEDITVTPPGSWIVDSLSFVSNGFAPVVPYTFPYDGVFQVTLYTYTPNGALLDSSSQAYTVVSQGQALDPQFSVSQSASNSCDSVELTFDITSINSQSYSYEYYVYGWNGTIAVIQGSPTMPNPTVAVPADMGWVDVLLFVHDGICQDSTSQTVFIDSSLASGSSIQASFSSSENVIGCDSVVIDLNNTSNGGSAYSWIVYDQFQNVVHSSSSENTSFTYDVNGVNTVNMLYIYYEVSDASGCSSYAYETLLLDSLGAFLYAFLETTYDVSCAGNGADGGAGINVYGGTPPYSYSLNGGPAMGVSSSYFVIDSLPAGTYSAEVMDASGCNVIVDFTVSAADSVVIYASEYFDACGNDSSGIFLQPSGSWPFTYQWSTGDTTSYVWGPTPGLVSVTVTDALGCSASYSTIVPDSNDCVELFGSVFLDDNANCIQDGNDAGLANIPILLTSTTSGNTYWTYSDAAGSYSIRVPEDNYDVETTWQYNSYYSPTCAPSFLSNVNLAVGMSWSGQLDFGYQIDSSTVQDLSVSITAFSTATPGFPYYNYIQYCNDGLLPMSGTVELTYDSQLEWAPSGNTAAGYYYNTYPLPTSSNTASQLLTWDFVNLAPYQCRTIYVDFNTPINMGLMPGMPVVQNVNITPVAGDATPSNNIASLNDSITSSWDPNDKAVYPAGQMSTDEKDHHYTIRFQNEGNGPAYRVVIRDVIDANLDLQTLRNVSASHSFVISQEVPGELAFIFDNINLVPQSVSEEGSQGFVSFTLSQVDDVPENTIISNTADIFFDFNPAITTNTVENLIKNEVTSISGLVSTLAIYPNPTSGLIQVESSNPVSNFVLTDMSGRRVWSMSNEVNSFTTDLSHIAPGMYLIQWLESGQLMHSRIQIH